LDKAIYDNNLGLVTFEQAAKKLGKSRKNLLEKLDIGNSYGNVQISYVTSG